MKLGGIDEAGRGPVVGPLVIAAVVIDESKIEKFEALGVKDSKKLSPKKREELFEKIIELVDDYFILELSPEDIDKREGTMNDFEVENFAKVLNSLKIKPDLVYIDAADVNEERFGIVVREKLSFYPKIIAEHKADSKYIPVAAASILAKVTRDKAIERLKEIYGNIGSGYPSDPITRKFLEEYYKEHGSFPPVVRRSWKTLKKIEEKLQKEKNQSNLLNFLKKS